VIEQNSFVSAPLDKRDELLYESEEKTLSEIAAASAKGFEDIFREDIGLNPDTNVKEAYMHVQSIVNELHSSKTGMNEKDLTRFVWYDEKGDPSFAILFFMLRARLTKQATQYCQMHGHESVKQIGELIKWASEGTKGWGLTKEQIHTAYKMQT